MSSNFMLVDNANITSLPTLCGGEPTKTYGFKRVTKTEMESILERLQRKTYNAELYFGERFQRIPSPPRPPSTVCKRLDVNRKEVLGTRNIEVMTNAELDRLIRRLRTPTASILANSESNAKRELPPNGGVGRRCWSAEGSTEKEREVIHRLSRTTTASRDKRVLRYAEDPVVMLYNQKNTHSVDRDRPLSRQEQCGLVQRMQVDTVASRGGKLPFCRKMPSTWKQSLAATEVSA